jgi:hypothetical protein
MKMRCANAIEVLPQAQENFVNGIDKALATTTWASGCKSWYLNARGRNVTLWPGFSFGYWHRMKNVKQSDFVLDGKH